MGKQNSTTSFLCEKFPRISLSILSHSNFKRELDWTWYFWLLFPYGIGPSWGLTEHRDAVTGKLLINWRGCSSGLLTQRNSYLTFEHSLNSIILYIRGMCAHQLPWAKLQLRGLKTSCSGYSAEMLQNWEWSRSPAPSWGCTTTSHCWSGISVNQCHFLQETEESGTRLIQLHFSACLPVKQQELPYINIFSEIWYFFPAAN